MILFSGIKYLCLFLPTNNRIPKEISWKLWFDEFFELWKSYCNAPSWEEELFELYGRLAFENSGLIEWSPYIEFLFPKFMGIFGIPGTGFSELHNYDASVWIIGTLGGSGTGKIIQKNLSKMISAMESYYHPANSDNKYALKITLQE